MEKKICECSKNANLLCPAHKLYFCELCAKKHPCKKIKVQAYLKQIRLKKVDIVHSMKALKHETNKNTSKLLIIHKEMVAGLTELKKQIGAGINGLINNYNKKIEKLIEIEMHKGIDEIESTINSHEKSRDWVDLKNYLDTLIYGKIRKSERIKFHNFENLLNTENYYNELYEFILSLKNQVTKVSIGVKENPLKTLDDLDEARDYGYNLISDSIKEEVTRFFKAPTLLYQVDKGKEEKGTLGREKRISKSSSSIRRNSADFRASRLQKQQNYDRGTDLVENTFADRIRNRKETVLDSVEVKTNNDQDRISLNSFSIESDDLPGPNIFGVIDDSHFKQIRQDYEGAKRQLKSLLERTADDIDKPGFFNFEGKKNVNKYMTGLIEELGHVTKDLLVSFNKL